MTEDKKKRAPGYAKTDKPEKEESMTFEEAMIIFNQGTMKALEYIIGLLQEIHNHQIDDREAGAEAKQAKGQVIML